MILTTYLWCLFIFVIVLVLMPALIYLVQLNEDGVGAGKASYLTFLTCSLSGLILIVGAMVVSVPTLNVLWKSVLIFVCLISSVTCFRYAKYDKHFLYSCLLTVGFSLLPFVYYGTVVPTSASRIANYFDDHFPMVLLSLWTPLFLFGLLMGYILVPREDRRIIYQNRDGNTRSNQTNRSMDNILRAYEAQNATLKAQVRNLNDAINTLQMQGLITKYQGTDSRQDPKIANVLSQLKEDMTILKNHVHQYSVKEINVDQETMVRELSHFLATPLATIEASCKALQDIPYKGKDQTKVIDIFDRILASVKMCNGIIGTYKEIFVGGQMEDSQNLSDLIRSSFDLYQKRDGKQLRLNIKMGNHYAGFSNYYLLSILLPLLSNAVTASKDKSTVEVSESGGVFRISNTYKENVDLANFEIDGYSSKPDHRGMGLYTVRHFLARRKLGVLRYAKKDNRIIFEVSIHGDENE